MKVLVLSPNANALHAAISERDDMIIATDPISPAFLEANGIEFIVSYGYRHIIDSETLAAVEGRTCNLHISMLPWNRGADPNFWCWFDNTPKGVSIHVITKGLDTGPIIAQQEVSFPATSTLATSYHHLQNEIVSLFNRTWQKWRDGVIAPRPQESGGTYHRSADKQPFFSRLRLGFDTPVADVERLGAAHRKISQ